MSKMMGAFSLAMLAASLMVSDASAQSAAGKWTAEYPTRISNTNGQAQADEMGTAVMTLEIKGDSAFGTWTANAGRDAGTPRALRGTFINGKLSVATEPVERTVMRNNGGGDEQQTVKMSTVLEGDVKGDEIEGSFVLRFEERSSPPLKWKARRTAAN